MKKVILFLFVSLAFTNSMSAQVPQGIPYQSIIRNSAGAILSNQPISLRFSIIDSIATGIILYRETISTSTNALGMVTVNIGQGIPVTGTFAAINWGHNYKFIQMEVDINGTSNYTHLGTTQMMSVPFALFSNSSGELKQSGSNSNTMLFTSDGF